MVQQDPHKWLVPTAHGVILTFDIISRPIIWAAISEMIVGEPNSAVQSRSLRTLSPPEFRNTSVGATKSLFRWTGAGPWNEGV
jgi:hypothetical protein